MTPPRRWGLAGPIAAIVIVVVLGIVAGILAITTDVDRPGPDRIDQRGPAVSEAHGAEWSDPALSSSNELVITDDAVCSTRRRVLYCVEGETGQQIFAETLPAEAGSPALVGETLVVADATGPEEGAQSIYGYSLDGRKLWEADVAATAGRPSALALAPEAPTVTGELVLAVSNSGAPAGAVGPYQQVVAIDAATGEERWRGPAGVAATVVADGDRVYTTVVAPGGVTADDLRERDPDDPLDMQLIALEPASGAELWRLEMDPAWGEIATVTRVVRGADETDVGLVIRGSVALLLVVDAATGARRWETELDTGATLLTRVAVADGVTVVVDDAGFAGYDRAGRALWSVPHPSSRHGVGLADSQLVVDHDRLFAVGTDVFEVDTSDGTSESLREDVFASDVVIADDLLVIAGDAELEAVPFD